MIQHFIDLYIFSASLCALISGSIYALSFRRSRRARIASILLLSMSLLLFEHYFSRHFQTASDSLGLALMKTAKFLIGPMLYLLCKSLDRKDGQPDVRGRRLHLIPWLAASAAVIACALPEYSGYHCSVRTLLHFLDLAALTHMSIYAAAVLFDTVRLYRVGGDGLRKIMRELFPSAAMTAIAMLSFIVYAISGERTAETSGIVLVATIVFVTIFDHRYRPLYMEKTEMEIRKVRYARSLLKGVDKDMIADRLLDLMEGEKVFCDEDLGMDRLSSMLGLHPHTLSEFINTRYDMNFSRFVNSYRVREAKSLLLEHRDRSVLSIAYASGFNSKTAFYRIFTEFTGISPREFRDRNAPGKKQGPDL